MARRIQLRFPLMIASILASLAAMWAGLVRLGWGLPPLISTLIMAHGPLMISGFLGTLINLERVVALNRRWMYAAPAATGLGALVLLVGTTAALPVQHRARDHSIKGNVGPDRFLKPVRS